MASIRGAQGSERILAKLNKFIESGQFYEAHQLYRTINFRYANSKKFPELRKILLEGATRFLDKGHQNSGADLANLYLNALSADPDIAEVLDNDEQRHEISRSIGRLFAGIGERSPERMQFTMTALKLDPAVFDTTLLHHQFALVLWNEKNYPEARYHFLHATETCGVECASMLMEYQVRFGFPAEVDLFVAQFILQLLCIGRNAMTKRDEVRIAQEARATNGSGALNSLDDIEVKSPQHALANQTLQSFTARHPQIAKPRPPYAQPLLNFLWFLLLAIEGGKSSTFQTLCKLYGPSLSRDPNYQEYLTRIGQIYFGERPPPKPASGMGGIFGNLLQSLMTDDNDESDEGTTPASAVSTATSPSTPSRPTLEDDLD